MKRREFFGILGTAVVAAPVLNSFGAFASVQNAFSGHKFPELGYSYSALEPYIDAQTMELHYSKHHKGYYDKFLGAAEGTDVLNTPMEQILAKISNYPAAIRNNGGGFYNHNLFWENMSPAKQEVSAKLKAAIEKEFNSIDEFKGKFGTAAKTLFGSGWAWLIIDSNGRLAVTTSPNQDNPLMDVAPVKGTPLLCLDVWEHAYYLKYQNRRPEYVDNFWNIVNWDVVNTRYLKAIG